MHQFEQNESPAPGLRREPPSMRELLDEASNQSSIMKATVDHRKGLQQSGRSSQQQQV